MASDFKVYHQICMKFIIIEKLDIPDENKNDALAIRMPIIDVIAKKPDFLPLSVPKEYLDELSNFHGDPFIWFAGQILNYLMRFNNDFQSIVTKKMESLNIKSPCVG